MNQIKTIYYDAAMQPVPQAQADFFIEREVDENDRTIKSQFGRVKQTNGEPLQEAMRILMDPP